MSKEKESKHEQLDRALNTYMQARTPEQHELINGAARQWMRMSQILKDASEWSR